MALKDIRDPASVLKAIDECDRLGREAFLQKYSYGPARTYVLVHEGREYDSKAIIGVAHGCEYPEQGPLVSGDFSGGENTVARKLRALGFVVRKGESSRLKRPEDDLTAALLEGYTAAGKAVGYWGTRFLQAVRRNGGLATARRMLEPRKPGQRKGLDALLAAGRSDLTVEAIVLRPKFRPLFTAAEILEAQRRLGKFVKLSAGLRKEQEKLYPDELESGRQYFEGARKQVRVNAYERDPRARRACIRHHGCVCAACGFDFESRYGSLGRGFIHVHHLKPLALTDGEYELDPVADLRPICPNCHAMIHRSEKLLTIAQLKQRLMLAAGHPGVRRRTRAKQ